MHIFFHFYIKSNVSLVKFPHLQGIVGIELKLLVQLILATVEANNLNNFVYKENDRVREEKFDS